MLDSVIQDAVSRIFAAPDVELEETIRQRLNEEGFDAEGSDTWLGCYRPMASPGVIQLHWQRLGRLFRETARHLHIDLRGEQARLLCQVLVAKTYGHEQFHFLSDVFSRIARQGEKDHEIEEALATTWGWFYCQAYAQHIDLNPMLTAKAVSFWFDEIKANGYCRWKEFAHRCFFEDQLATHLQLASIAASGDGRDLVKGLFMTGPGLAGLCEYQVVEGSGPGVPVFSCPGQPSAFPDPLMHQAWSQPVGNVPTKSLDLSGGKLSVDGLQFKEEKYDDLFLCSNPIGSLTEEAVTRVLKNVSAQRVCLRHCGLKNGLYVLGWFPRIALKSIVLDNFVAQNILSSFIESDKYQNSEADLSIELQCDLMDANLYEFASKST